jgi:hypothetical protein
VFDRRESGQHNQQEQPLASDRLETGRVFAERSVHIASAPWRLTRSVATIQRKCGRLTIVRPLLHSSGFDYNASLSAEGK